MHIRSPSHWLRKMLWLYTSSLTFLLILASPSVADDALGRYFALLDLDQSGYVEAPELSSFVTSMLTTAGMMDVDLDDESRRVGGKTLRELVSDAFVRADTDSDGRASLQEAIAAQEDIQLMMGTFMANNLPKSEF